VTAQYYPDGQSLPNATFFPEKGAEMETLQVHIHVNLWILHILSHRSKQYLYFLNLPPKNLGEKPQRKSFQSLTGLHMIQRPDFFLRWHSACQSTPS
jgi:hypothetical protein